MNNGHTQKRVEMLFPDTGQELETGVVFGIFQVDRLLPLGHQAHQALPGSQAGDADLLLVEALGGAKYKRPLAGSRM